MHSNFYSRMTPTPHSGVCFGGEGIYSKSSQEVPDAGSRLDRHRCIVWGLSGCKRYNSIGKHMVTKNASIQLIGGTSELENNERNGH